MHVKVAIIGFGHIGRSLWEVEKHYHKVYVCNRSPQKIVNIPNSTTDARKAVQNVDVVQICFPVEVKEGKPNVKQFLDALRKFRDATPKNALVIIESTIPVTTTEKAAEIFDEQHVAHSPVRGSEPHMIEDIKKYPKIVGGINQESTRKAVDFYKSVKLNPVPVVNSRVAELFKLANNVWQDINIAYANELARIAAYYEVDVNQVLELMETDPNREVRYPGYVGGHCVPDNPYLLCNDVKSELVMVARKTNEEVVKRTIKKVRNFIGNRENVKVAILGITYKPNVNSLTNSAAVKIINGLKNTTAKILIYDPIVDSETLKNFGEPIKLSQASSADIIVDCHNLLKESPSGIPIINAKAVY